MENFLPLGSAVAPLVELKKWHFLKWSCSVSPKNSDDDAGFPEGESFLIKMLIYVFFLGAALFSSAFSGVFFFRSSAFEHGKMTTKDNVIEHGETPGRISLPAGLLIAALFIIHA